MHYSPLEVKDASKVLQTLTEKIKAALDELHEQGFMHCDVRLPNICFNEQLAAVLIDVDRACRTNNVTRLVGVVASCMYRVPRGARDTFCLDFLLWWCVSCRFEEVRCASTTPNECPTHLEHCDGVVRVGSLCEEASVGWGWRR